MKRLIPFLAVMLLFVAIFAGSMILSNARAESTGFDDITVLDAVVGDDLAVAGDSTFGGAVNVVGNTTLGGQAKLKTPIMTNNAFTVTNNMTLTVSYGSYNLNAAGAVNLILNAGCTDGQIVTLYGEDAQTVTIADQNIRTSDGSTVAVGQYDIATFECHKNEWILISKLANS